MELLVTLAVGAMLGCGVAKTHPLVNAGAVIGAAAGVVGAWLGARALGGAFAPALSDHDFAAAIAGGAVGALILSAVVGAAVVALKRRRS